MSSYPRDGARLLLAAALLFGASLAHAHAPGGGAVKSRLDPLPAELQGVLEVQVVTTVAPQVILSNRGSEPAFVLDQDGQPFLRIGPDGVYANVYAEAYYRSRSPAQGVKVPEHAQTPEARKVARWAPLSEDRSWGWFDARINSEKVEVPHEIEDRGEVAPIGSWQLPVRVGEDEHLLTGRFVYEPLAKGRYHARLTPPYELAPGIRASLANGPVPALHIINDTEATVTVLGANGEPWLRMTPEGIYERPRVAGNKDQWIRIRGGSTLLWTESRATYGERSPPPEIVEAGKRAEVAQWEVPVLIDGEPAAIRGVIDWIPNSGSIRAARTGH